VPVRALGLFPSAENAGRIAYENATFVQSAGDALKRVLHVAGDESLQEKAHLLVGRSRREAEDEGPQGLLPLVPLLLPFLALQC
jgi:hypothetical protein